MKPNTLYLVSMSCSMSYSIAFSIGAQVSVIGDSGRSRQKAFEAVCETVSSMLQLELWDIL